MNLNAFKNIQKISHCQAISEQIRQFHILNFYYLENQKQTEKNTVKCKVSIFDNKLWNLILINWNEF